MIEVELRTFLTKEQYEQLLKEYQKSLKTEKQITYYYDCEQDFRMMQTKNYIQLWLKSGEIHDEARQEKIVKIDNKYKEELKSMLEMLKYNISIKWFRTRNEAQLDNNMTLCIDYTNGYGYILEIERLVNSESLVDETKQELIQFLTTKNIEVCDKKIFKEKYIDYQQNWEKYTKGIDEDSFLQ